MAYLPNGFESAVRAKLGVSAIELPDSDINNRYISQYAEAVVLKRVPNYEAITDDLQKIYLENAIIAYICYLLCPSLARRLNVEVSTIDVKWKKEKLNWDDLAQHFLAEVEENLSEVTTVSDHALGGIASFQSTE